MIRIVKVPIKPTKKHIEEQKLSSQFHYINSHKSGSLTRVDIHLSFEKNTSYEKIENLKKQMKKA